MKLMRLSLLVVLSASFGTLAFAQSHHNGGGGGHVSSGGHSSGGGHSWGGGGSHFSGGSRSSGGSFFGGSHSSGGHSFFGGSHSSGGGQFSFGGRSSGGFFGGRSTGTQSPQRGGWFGSGSRGSSSSGHTFSWGSRGTSTHTGSAWSSGHYHTAYPDSGHWGGSANHGSVSTGQRHSNSWMGGGGGITRNNHSNNWTGGHGGTISHNTHGGWVTGGGTHVHGEHDWHRFRNGFDRFRDDDDVNFFFGFYAFAPYDDCFVSPWYWYPTLPPYIAYSHCIVVSDYEPCDWNGGVVYEYDPYSRYNSYGNSALNYSVDELRKVFTSDDEFALGHLVPSDGMVAIYTDGKYEYSLNGHDFFQMVVDNVRNNHTLNYTITDVHMEGEQAIVKARHDIDDPNGGEISVYQEFRLSPENGSYVITDFMTHR